jgi:pSer/pThr/pTyr-binding forkhead associated (FHA) protein
VSAFILLVLRILLAALLYGFLGLAIYTLLRDLKQQGELLAARQPPPLTLTNLVEVNSPSQHYTKPVIILGRESDCDFPLDDQTVSSQHARLSYHQQQWWLEDLASTNGTFLNGEAVTTPVVITHGDELRLGHLGVRIEIGQITSSKKDELATK